MRQLKGRSCWQLMRGCAARRFGRRVGMRFPASGLLLAALLVSITPLAAGCQDEQKTAATTDMGGKLQLTESYFDFGTAPVGQQVQHDFVLKNTGTGPLDLGQMSVKRLEGC